MITFDIRTNKILFIHIRQIGLEYTTYSLLITADKENKEKEEFQTDKSWKTIVNYNIDV